MNDEEQYFAVVALWENGYFVKKLGPFSEKKARKLSDGIDINLNHDKYFCHADDIDKDDRGEFFKE
ncbi:MAG: hypothetical protein AAF902_01985 [Chloroflexota bacterium]